MVSMELDATEQTVLFEALTQYAAGRHNRPGRLAALGILDRLGCAERPKDEPYREECPEAYVAVAVPDQKFIDPVAQAERRRSLGLSTRSGYKTQGSGV